MGGQLPVGGNRGPAILEHPNLIGSGVHHRLDRDGHSGQKPWAPPGHAEVRHLRLLMHLPSYAVTYEGTDDRKTVRLHIRLDGMGDILHPIALFCPGNALIEALPGNVDKALGLELSQKAMQEVSDLKGFISCNNSSTLNAAEAISASKRKDVALVGFDYAKETAALIANPECKVVSIVQNQYAMGVESVKKAVELAGGAQAEQLNVDTGIKVVNSANYKQYEAELAGTAK